MKHAVILFFAIFLIQTGHSQSNLPNGGFENWIAVSNPPNNITYYQPDPVGGLWSTLNELVDIPPILGGPGPESAQRTEDAYSGTYAVKLISGYFGPPANVFIPGMMATTVLDIAHYTIHIGKPCPAWKPQRFKGFFKYLPVNGDSAAAILMMTKINPNTHKRDTLGYGKAVFHDTVTEYTPFDIPIQYTSSTDMPDSISIIVVSSAGFDLADLLAGEGQIGSTLWIDELSVENPAGVPVALMPEKKVNCYPNPADDLLNVSYDNVDQDAVFSIFNPQGARIREQMLSTQLTAIPLHEIPSGVYNYMITRQGHLMNSGSFIIRHP